MLAKSKVSGSSPTFPPTAPPQHSLTQRQTYTKASLQNHEKLRRLGEAATDVLCAGFEALFDKWGTQRMSQRMHRVTKSVQTTSGDIFQARPVSSLPRRRLTPLHAVAIREVECHVSRAEGAR